MASDGEGQRQVLLLYPESRLLPAVLAIDQAFRAALQSRSAQPVYFYTEYLDLNLFDGEAPQRELSELLRRKYAGRRIDLVLAASSRGLRIALRNRAELFSNAPVIFVAVDRTAAVDIEPAGDVTGTWLAQGWAGTLEAALRLEPRTRHVVVVSGTSPTADRVWLAAARAQLPAFEGRVDVRYLTDLPLEDVLKEVARLPDGTVVLLGPFLRDAAGRNYVGSDAIARIAAASRVPSYGLSDGHVGSGIVGGHVVSFEAEGTRAAELGVRLLRGERSVPAEAAPNVYVFDWRQLRRWKLDERRLPPGSVVRFREASAWDLYKAYIVGGLAVLLLQSGLIATLLVQRASRRRAQRALAERLRFETLLSELSATFALLPASDVHRGIDGALRRMGEGLDLDRTTLAELDAAHGLFRVTHSWTREGIVPIPPAFEAEVFPWTMARLRAGETVRFARRGELPVEAEADRRELAALGTRSLVVVPLVVGGSVVGTLASATVRVGRDWPDEWIGRLRLLGEVFANAVARRQAERALRESEERFRRMADSAPLMVWLAGPDGRRTYVNPRWLALTGRRLEDELGEGWLAAVHPDERKQTQVLVQEAVAGHRAFTTEYRLRRDDGEYCWILDHGAPRTAEVSAGDGYVGSAIDITTLKAAQQALLERDALRSAIFGSMNAQVATLDRDGVVIAVNDAWTRPGEQNGGEDATRVPVGANYLEACQSVAETGDLPARRALELIGSVREGLAPIARFEYHCPPGDRWFEMTVEPFRGTKGGVIVSHVDISRRRQAEEEARRQREELAHVLRVTTLGELAGSIAHEINQPLAAMLANAQAARRLLDAGHPPLPDVMGALADIAADAKRTSEIIRRLRALFRRESVEGGPVDLDRLAAEVVELLRSDFQRKGIRVHHAIGEPLPAVRGDAVQLQQMLLNILVNAGDAIAATEEGPRAITIESRGAAGRVVLSVRDTGLGVKDADLERIFQHFVSSKPDGLGMGLAISRSIVQAHGGRIWASANEDRGLTLYVELPVAAESA